MLRKSFKLIKINKNILKRTFSELPFEKPQKQDVFMKLVFDFPFLQTDEKCAGFFF